MAKKKSNLWDELKDRNVIRAAIAYLVTAWLIIQVAAIILPTFEAQASIMRWIVIVLTIGFPLTLLFAWFYEWTRAGLKKTGSSPKDLGFSQIVRLRLNRSIIVVLLLVIAIMIVERLINRVNSDPAPTLAEVDAIAVFPFSIQGNQSLQYLSEGMVDLISSKLDNIPGINTTDPNILISSVSSSSADLRNPSQMSKLANNLGANRFLIGSVTEIGNNLEIKISQYSRRGKLIGKTISESGDAESLSKTINRVIKKLVGDHYKDLGLDMADNEVLSTTSFKAIVPYIEGERLRRAGQLARATKSYEEAILVDSTFSMAWYRLHDVMEWRNWFTSWEERDSVFQKLKKLSRDLSGKNKGVVDAYIMRQQNHPKTAETYKLLIRQYGESVDILYNLAEAVYHINPKIGKSASEALPYLERALELDSSRSEIKQHLGGILLSRLDTARLIPLLRSRTDLDELQTRSLVMLLVLKDSVTEEEIEHVAKHPNMSGNVWHADAGLVRNKWYEIVFRIAEKNEKVNELAERYKSRKEWYNGRQESNFKKFDPGAYDPYTIIAASSLPTYPLNKGREQEFIMIIDSLNSLPEVGAGIYINYHLGLLNKLLKNERSFEKNKNHIRSFFEDPDPYRREYSRLYYYQLLGQSSFIAGRNQLAREYFDSANRLETSHKNLDAELHENGLMRSFWNSEMYFQEGEFKKALPMFEDWVVGPDFFALRPCYWGMAIYRTAQCYQALGNAEKAVSYFNIFLDIYKNADDIFDPWKEDAKNQLNILVRTRKIK